MFEKIGPSGLYAIMPRDGEPGGLVVLAAAETGAAPAESHAGTEAHGGAAGHKEPFPPFNSATFAGQLFWLAIFFGLLLWLMAKVALPRVQNILEGRAERIENDLAEANRLKAQTDEAIAAYEKTLGDARAEGHRIAGEVHEKVSKEAEAHRLKLEDELNAKIEASDQLIAEAKLQALGNVRGIAVDAASAIVERLSGKPPVANEVEKAVDASLAA
jgi:F-type H+-transporting ATPase subunit b